MRQRQPRRSASPLDNIGALPPFQQHRRSASPLATSALCLPLGNLGALPPLQQLRRSASPLAASVLFLPFGAFIITLLPPLSPLYLIKYFLERRKNIKRESGRKREAA